MQQNKKDQATQSIEYNQKSKFYQNVSMIEKENDGGKNH